VLARLRQGFLFVPFKEANMLQRFSCGHVDTCGFWKDDFWFQSQGLCHRCASKKKNLELTPSTKVIVKGNKRLVFKLAVVKRTA